MRGITEKQNVKEATSSKKVDAKKRKCKVKKQARTKLDAGLKNIRKTQKRTQKKNTKQTRNKGKKAGPNKIKCLSKECARFHEGGSEEREGSGRTDDGLVVRE
jgi:hypothetical protein